MIRQLTIIIIAVCIGINVWSQNHPPVATDDTLVSPVLDTTYHNLIKNDYDPDGDSFRIFSVSHSINHNDSMVIYYNNTYYKLNANGFLVYQYMLIDENGNTGPESIGKIFMKMDDPYRAILDVNNIKAGINSYGNHFEDINRTTDPYFDFPKNSMDLLLVNSSLWIGGIDENGDTLVAKEVFRALPGNYVYADFWSGPLSVDGECYTNPDQVRKWRNTWKLNKEEVLNHYLNWSEPGYEAPENILSWPAHGDLSLNQDYHLAPFVDVAGDDGYEPMRGDFPLIKGDQSIFFIFNDMQSHVSSTEPLGIEIHGFAWAYNRPKSPALNNTVFLSYKIINRSEKTISDTYLGVYTYFTIGHYFDSTFNFYPNYDYLGCDVSRSTYYGYSSVSAPWQGDTLKTQAVVLLGGPELDPDGADNPGGGCDFSLTGVGFGDGIVDNERLGMSNFNYFSSGPNMPWANNSSYQVSYTRMKSIWPDGSPITYGGKGHLDYGAYGPACRFVYPGLSDTCNWGTGGIEPNGPKNWTELTAGNEADQRMGLGSMGPFTLEPGEINYLDIAFVSALEVGSEPPLEKLMKYVDTIRAKYFEDPDNFGFEWLDVNETPVVETALKIYPNPAQDRIQFKVPYFGKQEIEYSIFDLYGREISRGLLNKAENQSVNIADLKKGFYILRLNAGDRIKSAGFVKQ